MLANQFIQKSIPILQLTDKASMALQLFDDYDVTHLPVKSEDKFVGIVSKDDVLDIDENTVIAALQENFIVKCVKENEHLFSVLKIFAEQSVSIVPVVNNEMEIVGTITQQQIIEATNNFIGNNEPGGIIVVEIEKRSYSFGEINRLVETNDAYITQLNTSIDTTTGLALITIKINKTEISDIVSTFQRFDYNVKYYFGDEEYANELKDNYNHLMSYLSI